MISIHACPWRAAARLFAIVVLGLPPSTGAGHAQQLTATQKNALRSCRSDYMANCMSVTPGGKEALVCLHKNLPRLSPACRQAVNAAWPKPAPVHRPAVVVAPSRPTSAVVRHTAPPQSPANAMLRYCRSDYMAHCANVPAGGHGALACLQRNLRRLTPACRRVVRATMPRRPAVAHHAPPLRRATVARPMPNAPPPSSPAARLQPSIANAMVMMRACKRDLFRHCRGVKIGGGRDMACLLAHRGSLSLRCRMALKVTSPLR